MGVLGHALERDAHRLQEVHAGPDGDLRRRLQSDAARAAAALRQARREREEPQAQRAADALEFNQVVIFVKSVQRAIQLDKLLQECNFPSVAIHARIEQAERIELYQSFKDFKHRILGSTDIWGRGIDIERVNIVINYDMPEVSDTYLHRVGRAGRFGTKGLAITFVSNDEDAKTLEDVQSRFEVSITQLPEAIDVSSYMTA